MDSVSTTRVSRKRAEVTFATACGGSPPSLRIHPTHPILFPLHTLARRQHVDRMEAVQHHRTFIGESLLALVGQGLGMRPVMDTSRVQRGHACLDVVAAEEIAVMIKNELVVVRVAMEERHFKGFCVLLQRTR